MAHAKPFYESRERFYDCHVWHHPDFPIHIHKHLELAYVTDGELAMTVSGKEYRVCKGEGVIVFPYQIHSYSSKDEVELTLVIADMEYMGEFKGELAQYELESPFFKKSQLTVYGQKILDLIRNSASDKNVPYQLDKGLFMVFLTDVFRTLPLKQKLKPMDLSMAQKLLQYINENIMQELSAAEVAKAMGISPYYLSHIFSEELKTSFPTYVAQQRLSLACDLLRTTGKSITEITYESGFSNMRTFHRCFQKRFGCTPTEWRKRN